MMLNLDWVAATAGMSVLIYLWKARVGPHLLFAQGDEDMKIASPGAFSTKPSEDASELEAQRFMRQKTAGNIDKARELGAQYALALLERNAAICTERSEDPLCLHQQLVLYSYTVNRVISELSPDSILAQTSLNVFYDALEEASPELYRHVSDMAAFSLYILCERSNSRSDDEIGRIYAQLCDASGDRAQIEQGNGLFQEFYQYCVRMFDRIEYHTV